MAWFLWTLIRDKFRRKRVTDAEEYYKDVFNNEYEDGRKDYEH